MSKKHIYSGVLLAALSTAAAPVMAQDASADDWSGFYVGGALGYGTTDGGGDETLEFDTDRNGDFDNTVGAPGNAFSPGFCGGNDTGPTQGTGCSDDDDGTTWSVHAGYDRQFGNFVVGGVVEGGKTDVTDYVTGFSTTPASYTFERDIDWNAAARLRAGYSLGSTLIYGTGGVAYAKVDNGFSTTNGVNTFTENGDSKEDMWGYTVGGGIDQKIDDNFSIGLLYKYTNYGESDYVVNASGGGNVFTTVSGSTDIRRSEDFDTHTAQVTTSFRF